MKKYTFSLIWIATRAFLHLAMLLSVSEGMSQGNDLNNSYVSDTLPNGLKYYIHNNEDKSGFVEFQFVVKAGSDNETIDQLGVAHVIEHIPFHGTTHIKDPWKYFGALGLIKGQDMAAQTGGDRTTFRFRIPTARMDIVADVMLFVRDIAEGISMDSSAIDRCRREVLAEMMQMNRISDRYIARVRGIPSTERLDNQLLRLKTETIHHAELRKFYLDWYRPDSQAVIIVGDLNTFEMQRTLVNVFSNMKRNGGARSKVAAYPPLAWSRQIIDVPVVGKEQIDLLIFMKYAAGDIKQLADLKREYVRKIVNNMLQQRFQEVNERNSLDFGRFSSTDNASFGVPGPDFGALTTSVLGVPCGNAQVAVKTAFRELLRLKRHRFIISEFEKAQTAVGIKNTQQCNDSRLLIEEFTNNFIKGSALTAIGKERCNTLGEIVSSIAIKDCNEYVSKVINLTLFDVISLRPSELTSNQFDSVTVGEWIDEVNNEHIKEFQYEELSVVPAMNAVAVERLKAPSVKLERDRATGLEVVRLPNGISIYFRPLPAAHDKITIHGVGKIANDDPAVVRCLADIPISHFSGFGELSGPELRRFMKAHSIKYIRPFIVGNLKGFETKCEVDGLEPALQALFQIFVAPKIDDTSHADMEKYSLSLRMRKEGKALLADTIGALIYGSNIDEIGPGSILECSYDSTISRYKQEYRRASDFDFIILGAFETKEIFPLVVKYIASLPNLPERMPFNRKPEKSHVNPPVATGKNIVLKSGEIEYATVKIMFRQYAPFEDDEYCKLLILAKVIESALYKRLREEDGLTYAVGVSVSYGMENIGQYVLGVSFQCSPGSVEQALNHSRKEFNHLKTTDLDPGTLQYAISAVQRDLIKDANEEWFWVNWLKGKVAFENKDSGAINHLSRIGDINFDHVKQFAQSFLDNTNSFTFILLPTNSPKEENQ